MQPAGGSCTSKEGLRTMSFAEAVTYRDAQPVTLVWIDAREAVIVTWADDEAHVQRVAGALPPHERSIGHIRIDPAVRHGGGLRQDKLDHRRAHREHQYLEAVAGHIPAEGPVEVIGSGELRLHLARLLREGRPNRAGPVTTEAARPLTEAQLIARVRELAGHPAPRQVPQL